MAKQEGSLKDPPKLSENGLSNGQASYTLPKATEVQRVPRNCKLDHPSLYFNRELSWLDFNWRVLHLAMDDRNPLLERVRFLAIASSNLDELFRKRVGGLKRQVAAGVRRLSPDGRTPKEQLLLLARAVPEMYSAMGAVWSDELKPALKIQADVRIMNYNELIPREQARANAYFEERVFPILTPLAVDPGHPFPFISNLSLSLAVMLRHPRRGTEHFARLKVPTGRGRWVRVNEFNHFVPIEQVIAHNIQSLFKGMDILGVYPFRITRNADMRRDEEEADDLIQMIAEELRERRYAPVVRLEIQNNTPEHVRLLLMRELLLDPEDVYETRNGLVDHSDCATIANLNLPEHQYEPWEPVIPSRLRPEGDPPELPDIFKMIQEGDILVHHPYESFRVSTQQFIEAASEDPQVIAIKQTLYRTSDESPVIKALSRAAEREKQVAVLVEVKARFDEENNIEWAQTLEKSGVHVTYGLVGLKTHTKVTLVVREEDGILQTYSHIGTGNYNPATARLYTDYGLLTADRDRGYDLINLFHYLTGYSVDQEYKKLLVAPKEMRNTFIALVAKEIKNQKAHGNGHIIAQMNALDDVVMIQQLYKASQAGVKIELIVRGHCRLRPGLEKISENITVISILGRFLEHSRIYYFHQNGKPRVYIGSADWMRRNLDDRVEVITEIEAPELRDRLIDTLQIALADRRSAWQLDAEGRYRLYHPKGAEKKSGFQDVLMRQMLKTRDEKED